MTVKKVYIGWERLPIYEDLSVLRCFNCQHYQHKTSECKKQVVCSYCAGEHNYKDCSKNNKKCINCENSNEKFKLKCDTNHEATDKGCPTYKHFLQRLINNTDYQYGK